MCKVSICDRCDHIIQVKLCTYGTHGHLGFNEPGTLCKFTKEIFNICKLCDYESH